MTNLLRVKRGGALVARRGSLGRSIRGRFSPGCVRNGCWQTPTIMHEDPPLIANLNRPQVGLSIFMAGTCAGD